MKIYTYIGIGIAILSIIIGSYFKINSYIDNQVEIKYQARVSDFMLQKQNEAILNNIISTKLFKNNLENKQIEIKKQVEYIQVRDETCEAKLEAIQELINLIY